MAKKLTQKRKAELLGGLLNWLVYEISDEEQHIRALIWAGMTDEEISNELAVAKDIRTNVIEVGAEAQEV